MRGWTFAYKPVPLGPPEPWDYVARARDLAGSAGRVLDLGTGGGEVFEQILQGYSRRAAATEAWAPNVAVAARRLRSLGAEVVHSNNLALPFAAGSLDLVLNRHEELSPADVARVLRSGGRVLTQQVGPSYHDELREFFPRMTVFERHDITYPLGLVAAGLELLDLRHHPRRVAYHQLGHLAYFLAVAPWTIPDFDLDSDLDSLLEVERRLDGPEGIVLSDPRYILEARKPA
jgi:SAM-dependent methyltransferase